MDTSGRIYLDNAATSWPKPDSVYSAVDHYQRTLGAAAGRGSYSTAVDVARRVMRTRQRLAGFLGVSNPEQIVFLHNGTDALNWAIHGMVRPGDHVVTTVAEHNSVLRPLAWLAHRHQITVTYVGCDAYGIINVDELRTALRQQTRLVVLTHASNVTGSLQPVDTIAALAHDCGARIVVDAAQSVGHVSLSLDNSGWDLVAFSGHKGLMGPLGTGVLYVRPELAEELQPLRQGGTGTDSERELPPDQLPDRYEPGNLDVPGILGLGAAVDFLLEKDRWASLLTHQESLTARLLEGLLRDPRITVYGLPRTVGRIPVVSWNMEGYDPQELASLLDSAARIEVRAGLHCAPRMHQWLGTAAGGGTVRAGLGCFNTDIEIDTLLEVINSI